MIINILNPITKGPWGGANQFLGALKDFFCKERIYTKSPEDATVILFNLNPSSSFHDLLLKTKYLKKLEPTKLFITRIDGPIFLIRGNDSILDAAFYEFVNYLSDGNILQSKWSKYQNYEQGLKQIKYETVITNSPRAEIFNYTGKIPFSNQRKTRLIATSWSSNWRKGFDTYKWIDSNLDFNNYDMTFIGNTPTDFKNIHYIDPLPSDQLSKEIKKHDIYITASRKDPCSNALIEALSCGLPAIARNDGGHPELIKEAGALFNEHNEIPVLLNKIVENYNNYQDKICVSTIDEVGRQYINFIENIYNDFKLKKYIPKTFNYFRFYSIYSKAIIWKIKSKLYSLIK